MNRIIAFFAIIFLIGCSQESKIVEKPILIEKPELIVPNIIPVEQHDFEWLVLTKQNISEMLVEMENKGQIVVLFAMTPQGYQNLNINMAELRRFIVQQQSVILAYKKYYGKSDTEK